MLDDNRNVIVDIKAVAKHYGEGQVRVDALRNLDLTVHAGEVVALLGPLCDVSAHRTNIGV